MKNTWVIVLGILIGLGAMAGSAECWARQAGIEETDVFVGGRDGVVEYRIPVLVTSTKGTLLAFCDARVEKPGDAPNYIRLVMKRSTDGGRTWGPLKTLVDPGKGAVCDSCGLVDRETGTIWVFSGYYPDGVSDVAALGVSGPNVITYQAVKSDDDGETWSQPIDLTAMLKKPEWRGGSFGTGAGIQMRNGRLILPRYYSGTAADAYTHITSLVSYSDDHGRTWHYGGEAKTEGGTNECQVAELADGSLLLNMRGVKGNHRKIARSRDGGITWSQVVEDPALIEPRCQASLASFPDAAGRDRDRLLFANPASTERQNFTVRLSYDGGKTWTVTKQLYAGPSGYSCLSLLPDSTAVCLYERGTAQPYEKIEFARFDTAWLSARP